MGVGGCETKTIGYTCRSVVRKVFGPGFNSRRLHQTALRACRWPLYLIIVIEASGYTPQGFVSEYARPRALNVRGDISLPPVKYDRTLCIPPALRRVIVMDAGGKNLPVSLFSQLLLSLFFSPTTANDWLRRDGQKIGDHDRCKNGCESRTLCGQAKGHIFSTSWLLSLGWALPR